MAEANLDIEDLLNEPREALDIEVKQWLDLTDHNHRALLAKEIIALANHGGGYIVVGFEERDDGNFEPAKTKPQNLNAWSQDSIQGIISKYIDPPIQCKVVHQTPSDSDEKYPIIVVPGGHRVPIRSKAGAPDNKSLEVHRVYIRRPGPNSEQPRTAEEWDRLFERCLQGRQLELLEAMRSIMAGVIPTAAASATPTRSEELSAFEKHAVARWKANVDSLPEGAPPRFRYGHYDAGFAIEGDFNQVSLANLRQIAATEVRNHSGWPPFLTLDRPPYQPQPVDGAVECWIGPDSDGSYDKPGHHDFWRISDSGMLFTRRGYTEDGWSEIVAPSTAFDITTPTWRIGEAILEAGYICKALNAENANLICHCHWVGLAGRRLVSIGNSNRIIGDRYIAAQDECEGMETVAVAKLESALPELVFSLLAPLYELFNFFALPRRLVEEELAALRRNRF